MPLDPLTRALVPTPNGGQSVYGQNCVQNHQAVIFDRGGSHRLYPLVDLTSVDWSRVRDGKSQATITLSGRACSEQGSTLSKIEPRRHELVIFRGAQRVWEGPIIDGDWSSSNAKFVANDVLEYLDGRALSRNWPLSTGTPVSESSSLMTERVKQILDYELHFNYMMRVGTGGAGRWEVVYGWESLDPPVNVWPHVEIHDSATLLTRSDTVAMEMTVGEHLYNLGRGGLDYTVVGRRLVIWDSELALGKTRILTEADFYGDFHVFKYGAEHASITHVSGARPEFEEDFPAVGNAGATHPYYGSWTRIVSLSSEEGSEEPTQDELNSQAQRDQVGRTPVPMILRVDDGAGIKLNDTLPINMLVPGVIVPVRATLNMQQVKQDQLLDKMKVTETAEGETVSVSLIPSGRLGRI